MAPDPNRWDEVKRLFQEALEVDAGARKEYLDRHYPGNEEVRAEVELLLAQHDQAGNFLDKPLIGAEDLSFAESSRLFTDTVPESIPEIISGANAGAIKIKGRYRVERELARGGFGAVYLARDETLHDKFVVVKVLLPVNDADALWVRDKFAQEVRALSLIDHPGVVGILDSGFLQDRRPFFVMQYVEGKPLQAIKASGIPLPQIAPILDQIGQALGAAHDKGVWHRDLKPSNIMIQTAPGGDLIVRLIDFGIATITERERPEAVTRIVGSLAYMAPEQLQGRVSRATDLYSFGVIAYEMLTGRIPFSAVDPISLQKQQETGVSLDLERLEPPLFPETEQLLRQALSFRPELRPANASQFGRQLARSLSEGRPKPARPNRRSLLAGGVAAGVLVVSSTAYWTVHRGNAVPTTLSLSLLVQPMRNDQPSGHPSLWLPGTALHPSEKFILQIQTTRRGHLYALNEDERSGTLTTLFPAPHMYGASSEVDSERAKQIPENTWYHVDPQSSVQSLWLVWSEAAVAELEALQRWLNRSDRGQIHDEAERSRVRAFLRDAAQKQKGPERVSGTQLSIASSESHFAWKILIAIQQDLGSPEPKSAKAQ